MNAKNRSYLKGAKRLYNAIEKDLEEHDIAFSLWKRLEINLSEATKLGKNNDNSSQFFEIFGELNHLTDDLFGKTFEDYCQEGHKKEDIQQAHGFRRIKPDASLPKDEHITEIYNSKDEEIKEHRQIDQEDPASLQSLDFLLHARSHITTLLACLHSAGQAYENSKLLPHDCTHIYQSFQLFSYADVPTLDRELWAMRVELLFLNTDIQEIITSFRDFCEVCKKTGSKRSTITQQLTNKLPPLRLKVETFQLTIESLIDKKFPPNEQSQDAIS